MVFGVNIGNTNFSSAVSQSNRVSIIANAGGEHRTRSVVAKNNEGGFSVGTAALSSRNTVLFDDILHTFEMEGGKHMITKQSGGLTVNTRVESCLGALITEISETCRDSLSTGNLAVIAVPDFWKEKEINGFKDIFQLASKFTVKRTLSHSVAAWLATKQNGNLADLKQCAENEQNSGKQMVLVIRIGGTSTSATLLEDYNGLITRKESITNREGADLVVRSISDMLVKESKRKLKCDITESKKSLSKIEKEARRAVEVLSNKDTAAIQIESLYDGMDFQTSINRGRVEALTPYKNILDPIFPICDGVTINRVVVIGGGGKSPKLQSLIRSKFKTSEVAIAQNCEDLVSIGCAMQSHIINVSNEVSCEGLPSKLALSPISLYLHSSEVKKNLINLYAPLPVSFTFDCESSSEIYSDEISPTPLIANLVGHVSGSFTKKGLVIKNNDQSFELDF